MLNTIENKTNPLYVEKDGNRKQIQNYKIHLQLLVWYLTNNFFNFTNFLYS